MRLARGRRMTGLAVVALALTVVAAACSGSGAKTLIGAGSTFAQPVYQTWGQAFKKLTGAQMNYQGIGSGGGIADIASQTVDFGATDVPLQTTDISTLKGGSYIEFPTALGAVAIVYNVPGVKTGLKLDAATVANIYLGKVKTWNDPAIASQNPGVNLPNSSIHPVYRADESGTSAVFTGWLSAGSPTWSSQVGAGKSVQWPTGVGANQSSGVAAAVGQTPGSISYVSQDYALTGNLSYASIKGPGGGYVAPSLRSISAAGAGLSFPITPTTNILNSTAPGAYPIASTTYVVVYTNQKDKQTAQDLVDFWYWGLTKGQAGLSKISYAPLPAPVAQAALGELSKITFNGQPVTPSASVK